MAVCESTCFGEPILVYGKGAVINLYQLVIKKQLPFTYMAVNDAFITGNFRQGLFDSDGEQVLCYSEPQMEAIYRYNKSLTNAEQHDSLKDEKIELYSLEEEVFTKLCDAYPKAKFRMQAYCLEQIRHLSETRQKKQHVHSGNEKQHRFRKNQINLEKRIDVTADLGFEFQ